MTGAVTELPRRSRRLEAYHEIRDLLVSCELAPGSSFTEGELAARLGTSTVPVREALLMLAGHHLVEARHGSGYTVAPVTEVSAREAYRVRVLLESEALTHAARHDALRTAEHLRAIVASTPPAHERLFHLHVGQHSGSLRLMHALELALLESARTENHLGVAASTMGHDDIATAIERGDAAPAKRLLKQHIRSIEHEVLAALR